MMKAARLAHILKSLLEVILIRAEGDEDIPSAIPRSPQEILVMTA